MPSRPPIFRLHAVRTDRDREVEYDRARGSAASRLYGPQWVRASKAFLARQPLCLGCQATGRTVAAQVVDHVIPHKGDIALFWDMSRWQPACKWHHDAVKQVLERRYHNGSLDASQLWLNSVAAIALTRELDP